MSIRIPPRADSDLRSALLDIEEELAQLRHLKGELIALRNRQDTFEREMTEAAVRAAYTTLGDVVVDGDIRVEGELNVIGRDKGLVVEGLVQAVPAGTGGASRDQRVVNVFGSLAVVGGGIAADTGRFREVWFRRPSVRLRHSADTTHTSSVWEALAFDTEEHDPYDLHTSGSNTRITIPAGAGGVWAVGGSFRVDLTANKYVAGAVRINGTTLTHATYMHGSHTQIGAVVLSAIVLLAGGDYIELVSNSDVAAPYTVEGGETYSPVFWAFKVSD